MLRYYTAKTAQVFKNKEEYVIGLGRGQFISNEDDFKIYSYLIEEFKNGVTIENFNKISAGNYSEYLKKLVEAKIIIPSKYNYTDLEKNRELKNRLHLDLVSSNAELVLEKFRETTFIIAGCGGIGNFLAYCLSSYRIKKIVLVDFDKIEESNLNRQLMFSFQDIGRYKVEALRDRLLEVNPHLNIDIEYNSFDLNNMDRILNKYPGNKFVALSADSADIIPAASKKLPKLGVPFLNIGYLNEISVIGPFWIDSNSACPMCGSTLGINDDSQEESDFNKEYSAPSTFINNSFAVAMAFSDIISYFAGDLDNIQSLDKRIGIDNLDFSKYSISIEKDTNCGWCESN